MKHTFMIAYANDKNGKMKYVNYESNYTYLSDAWQQVSMDAIMEKPRHVNDTGDDWYVQSIVYTAR